MHTYKHVHLQSLVEVYNTGLQCTKARWDQLLRVLLLFFNVIIYFIIIFIGIFIFIFIFIIIINQWEGIIIKITLLRSFYCSNVPLLNILAYFNLFLNFFFATKISRASLFLLKLLVLFKKFSMINYEN